MKAPECSDCLTEGITKHRPIVSGVRVKRCSTHARAHRKKAKAQSHSRMVERTYGISESDYWLIYEAQGGKCAICQHGRGLSKRLAVDHDHQTNEVHGLLCTFCNVMLGRLGREVDAYVRAINFLKDPPARRLLGPCFVPSTDAPTPSE